MHWTTIAARSHVGTDEIIASCAPPATDPTALRLPGVIVVPRRAGLRISEALAPVKSDLDRERGAVLVRHDNAAGVARSG